MLSQIRYSCEIQIKKCKNCLNIKIIITTPPIELFLYKSSFAE